MQMTDDEIRSSMRKAKNPGEQVKVLAELNACGESEVRAKLEQLGIEIPATKPKAWKFDTSRASQLLAEGVRVLIHVVKYPFDAPAIVGAEIHGAEAGYKAQHKYHMKNSKQGLLRPKLLPSLCHTSTYCFSIL